MYFCFCFLILKKKNYKKENVCVNDSACTCIGVPEYGNNLFFLKQVQSGFIPNANLKNLTSHKNLKNLT